MWEQGGTYGPLHEDSQPKTRAERGRTEHFRKKYLARAISELIYMAHCDLYCGVRRQSTKYERNRVSTPPKKRMQSGACLMSDAVPVARKTKLSKRNRNKGS
jgi:hypothetical protein